MIRRRKPVLLIDLDQQGFTVSLAAAGFAADNGRQGRVHSFCLQLGKAANQSGQLPQKVGAFRPTASFTGPDLSASFAEIAQALLRPHGHKLHDCIVVLGHRRDPLSAFGNCFEAALRLIEFIAQTMPRLFVLQTRSALALLTVPLLCRERTILTIGLESLEPGSGNGDLSMHSAHPEERLRICRTLTEIGIPTVIQACPSPRERDLERYARVITASCTYVYAADPLEITRGTRPQSAGYRQQLLRSRIAAPGRSSGAVAVPSLQAAWRLQLRELERSCLAA